MKQIELGNIGISPFFIILTAIAPKATMMHDVKLNASGVTFLKEPAQADTLPSKELLLPLGRLRLATCHTITNKKM